jgi:hypothetical protein
MKLKSNGHTLVLFLALCSVFYALAGECSALKGGGEAVWRMPGLYANLTIDDPWLIEPYGHLKYMGLLDEMEKANFHTTIAFIPWNYDRSKDEVAALFRERPDKFSICVHGNNHDHQEFYKYETDLRDSWPEKPLRDQEENIVQAVARMEKFRELTGVSYDRLMVFPHAIAPVKTLGLLKKYGFLSTVNAGNVPLGGVLPGQVGSESHFEPPLFDNFVSLNRWSASTVIKDDIVDAISKGKPLLFYVHHEFFEIGIDAFNPIAEMINSIEPRVQWKSLGYISRHLYLQKKREDSNYDVRSFSRSIELENKQKRDVTYFVRKEESFIPPIEKVTADGKPYPYQSTNNEITITITIPAGKSCLIDIEYENDLDLGSIDVSKKDLRVNLLREFSDFRDMTLSTNVIGRTLIYFHYETGFFKLGLVGLGILLVVLAVLITSGSWYLRRHYKKRRI